MALLISFNNHQHTSKPVEGLLLLPWAPHREHSAANPNTPLQQHRSHFGSFTLDDREGATLQITINPPCVESQKLGVGVGTWWSLSARRALSCKAESCRQAVLASPTKRDCAMAWIDTLLLRGHQRCVTQALMKEKPKWKHMKGKGLEKDE